MATINIRRDVADPFYRYKMEKIQSKIEGKGNGIKTVIPNLTSVAQSLARPPNYVIKYFGFELGAQTNKDPKDDRWIINGAHESAKLQDYLDGFISKFVLCKKCKNPETEVHIKDGRILLDCKACGQRSEADPRLKLSGFILKDQKPGKGKKDKATKKAERKARKDGENGNENGNGNSPGDSNSDGADENGDDDGDGSDDELTRRINAEAKEIENVEPKEIEWSVDTSEAAVKARAKDLPDDLKRALVLEGEDDEEGGDSVYDTLADWISAQAKEQGSVSDVDNIEIYKKAQELGIEKKHRTLTVLAQTLFDDKMVKEIEERAPLLKKLITSERHQKALLGGTERFLGITKPNLIPQTSVILIQYYQEDLITEEVAKAWCTKASKKFVDLSTSKKIRIAAKRFVEWLDEAEEESSDEEE
ncbi:hypothetical protein EJ08DRAFT_466696 [Tothia fuscella]|uniref:W2 domain-containing protein n=1 Tax=Tothia fuscella TaxID=1048955 RepID=A0A9P4U2W8_9PEZI|nr:hypothetical protein EJ08DRAFT_466696 [Tothia fuscella]